MTCNTEFKILFEGLDNSRVFSICHLLTAQYISECQGILLDTELLNVMLLCFMARVINIL